MPNPRTPLLLRRAAAETGLLLAAGLFMAVLGPFGTAERATLVRMAYWPTVIVGGGVIGIAIDILVRRRVAGFWLRLGLVTALMTAPVAALVWAVSWVMLGPQSNQPHLVALFFQVAVISLGVMGLRQVAWRGVWTERAATDAQAEPIDPSGVFRQRLSAKRRAARLLAVEAEDHYLRVHTDAGDELITLRFSDALQELAGLAGYQTHRSWWVAAGAIEAVRWRRGRGELRLVSGLTAPVSRTHTAVLKREGWF
ncbi:LytTR family DNA-binding domain-containing protein [Phenylobacterium sp.]|uniref:LytTR family DNA-binding domain-containing protein n=1 Tax=Phenylobacterium sp. TaxID=1871053 RepID=UPI003561525A